MELFTAARAFSLFRICGVIALQDGVEDGGNAVEFVQRDTSDGSPQDCVGVDSAAEELLFDRARIQIHDSGKLA